MKERYCAGGNHFRNVTSFRSMSNGRPARDCVDCELAKERGRKASLAAKPARDGLDIDAIHYKLGAVRGTKTA